MSILDLCNRENRPKYLHKGFQYGVLVLSYWSGLVDATDRCFLFGTPYGLMDVTGIRSTEIDALYDWEENHAVPNPSNHLNLQKTYRCTQMQN